MKSYMNKHVLVKWNLDHCIIPKEIDLYWRFLVYGRVSAMMNTGVIWPSGWWSQCPPQKRSLLNRAVSLWINPINYNTCSWPVPFFQEDLHIWGNILCGLWVICSFTRMLTTIETRNFQMACTLYFVKWLPCKDGLFTFMAVLLSWGCCSANSSLN